VIEWEVLQQFLRYRAFCQPFPPPGGPIITTWEDRQQQMNQHDGTARKIIGQFHPEDLMGNGMCVDEIYHLLLDLTFAINAFPEAS
jgi:hypothetical protein